MPSTKTIATQVLVTLALMYALNMAQAKNAALRNVVRGGINFSAIDLGRDDS